MSGGSDLQVALHADAPVVRLPRRDGRGERGGHAGAALQVLVGERLFQPVEVERLEFPSHPDRRGLVPPLIDVGQELHVRAERLAEPSHALHVLAR